MQNNIAILCTTLYLISQGTRIFVLVKPKHGILKNPGQTTLKTWKIKSGSTFAHLNLALNVGVFRFFPCNVKYKIGFIIKIFFFWSMLWPWSHIEPDLGMYDFKAPGRRLPVTLEQ